MSRFFGEALFIGIKEGVKLSLCVLLMVSFFRSVRLDYLRKPLFAAILAVFLASFAAMAGPATVEVRDVVVKLIGYVFGLFYLVSLGALFHTTGTDMLGPLNRLFGKKPFLILLVFLSTVIYFVPDMAGSSLYVADAYSMTGKNTAIFAAAGAGLALSLFTLYLAAKKIRVDVMRLFGLPQILLSLALVKLVAGGVKGFAELSLIPSAQAGLMKLVHDVVHQTFLFLMVPDHPLLSVTTWNFIGVLFGSTVGLWLSLIIITLPLIVFIRKHFAQELDVPSEAGTGARRRRFLKAVRDERVLKSLPVFLFILVIVGTWFTQKGETAAAFYSPEPRPLSADGGKVAIPLQEPGEDLLDGAAHKFLLSVDGEDVRLLIMKKPDSTLAICLDACELCPPDGYGQAREHVVCLYCRTPIPLDALGRAGGCNPIPLNALVTDKDVQIEVSEIAGKWKTVKTGQTRETAEK